ncbi:MAG: hypothetical protein K9L30_03340 [Desulfobacterales bacterium]|nr:hypothetical protein [Desulfobacterales bacterium]
MINIKTNSSGQITFNKIFIFWAPLAATWFMIAFEMFIVAAIIARLPDPKYNLAAYGVAFPMAWIFEAPILMITSAVTAFVKNLEKFKKLFNFTMYLNGIVTIIMAICMISPIFYFISTRLMDLPQDIARMAHISLIILLPWPAAIGYRRFYQGILIINNRTRLVAFGTFLRIISLVGTALLLARFTELKGVYVGMFAMTVAVLVEAALCRIMAHKNVKEIHDKNTPFNNKMETTYKSIFKFYYPLVLTSILSLGSFPLITFFLGHSRSAIDSLAVFPVISSLAFFFGSICISYLEAVIALLQKNIDDFYNLRNFAFILGISLTILLTLVTCIPVLSHFWFHHISGLSDALTAFAFFPAIFISFAPGLAMIRTFQRAILVFKGNTSPITGATVAEIVSIVIIMTLSIYVFDIIGALAATIALFFGRLSANLYLVKPYKQVKKEVLN